MEIFPTSPLYVSGKTVAFETTILFVTHTLCRIPRKGITTLTYNEHFLIQHWHEYYDSDSFNEMTKSCSFLPFEETEKPAEGAQKEEL